VVLLLLLGRFNLGFSNLLRLLPIKHQQTIIRKNKDPFTHHHHHYFYYYYYYHYYYFYYYYHHHRCYYCYLPTLDAASRNRCMFSILLLISLCFFSLERRMDCRLLSCER